MLQELIPFLIPIVVGAITVPLYDVLQAGLGLLQGLPAWLTRIIVGVGAFFLAKLVLAGVLLTGVDLTLLGLSDVASLASAGLAYLFKLADKAKTVAVKVGV